jgi:hypothetical protein
MNLDNIMSWAIDEIFLDDEIEYGDGSNYSRDDFLHWVQEVELKPGYLYLFGFERNLLCEVVKITSEYCKRSPGYENTRVSLYLKNIANLDEQKVEIKRADNNTYTMEVIYD